jgi:hypothetical protein
MACLTSWLIVEFEAADPKALLKLKVSICLNHLNIDPLRVLVMQMSAAELFFLLTFSDSIKSLLHCTLCAQFQAFMIVAVMSWLLCIACSL